MIAKFHFKIPEERFGKLAYFLNDSRIQNLIVFGLHFYVEHSLPRNRFSGGSNQDYIKGIYIY